MALRNIAPIIRRWWPLGAAIGGLAILGGIVRSLTSSRDDDALRVALSRLSVSADDLNEVEQLPGEWERVGIQTGVGRGTVPVLDVARRYNGKGRLYRVPVIWSNFGRMFLLPPDEAARVHGQPAGPGIVFIALPDGI